MIAVVNPASGQGRAQDLVAGLGIRFQNVLFTDGSGTWRHQFRDLLGRGLPASEEGRPHVVVAGGDGTISQVVHELVVAARQDKRWHQARLLLCPAGSGNDIVRGLCGAQVLDGSFPERYRQGPWVSRSLGLTYFSGFNGGVDPVSVGSNSPTGGREIAHTVTNMASLGYGGQVVSTVERLRAHWWKGPLFRGRWAYQLAGFMDLFSLEDREVLWQAGGPMVMSPTYPSKIFSAFVGNLLCNGGGLYWFGDRSRFLQESFGVFSFQKPSPVLFLKALDRLKQKESLPFESFRTEATHLEWTFPTAPCPLEIDGEFIGTFSKMSFRFEPHQWNVLVPDGE